MLTALVVDGADKRILSDRTTIEAIELETEARDAVAVDGRWSLDASAEINAEAAQDDGREHGKEKIAAFTEVISGSCSRESGTNRVTNAFRTRMRRQSGRFRAL